MEDKIFHKKKLLKFSKIKSKHNMKVYICCMGAGYVGGPAITVIADKCPRLKSMLSILIKSVSIYGTARRSRSSTDF